jgi:hypothetical protein
MIKDERATYRMATTPLSVLKVQREELFVYPARELNPAPTA